MDKKSSGFTLLELIVVIAIMGILAAVATPKLAEFRRKADESVCSANIKTIERNYSAYLAENDIYHTHNIFIEFVTKNLEEVCPSVGVISYEDGKVKCNMHDGGCEGEKDKGPGEEVPWL